MQNQAAVHRPAENGVDVLAVDGKIRIKDAVKITGQHYSTLARQFHLGLLRGERVGASIYLYVDQFRRVRI